ncbi:unnamed protein product [Withania somnifera]
MRVLTNRLSRALCQSKQWLPSAYRRSPDYIFASPWFATQNRGVKNRGADLKPGNVIEKKGRIYQVVKAQHTTQGRGGAIIQVELRDVDSGSKSSERFRTDETIERVFVTEKSFTYLYTDDETGNIVLMEPMSASIPTRVTCTVAESEIPMRASATPQYKKVLLDNGLTVQVPKHILEGDKIIVNTTNHSYVSRA